MLNEIRVSKPWLNSHWSKIKFGVLLRLNFGLKLRPVLTFIRVLNENYSSWSAEENLTEACEKKSFQKGHWWNYMKSTSWSNNLVFLLFTNTKRRSNMPWDKDIRLEKRHLLKNHWWKLAREFGLGWKTYLVLSLI